MEDAFVVWNFVFEGLLIVWSLPCIMRHGPFCLDYTFYRNSFTMGNSDIRFFCKHSSDRPIARDLLTLLKSISSPESRSCLNQCFSLRIVHVSLTIFSYVFLDAGIVQFLFAVSNPGNRCIVRSLHLSMKPRLIPAIRHGCYTANVLRIVKVHHEPRKEPFVHSPNIRMLEAGQVNTAQQTSWVTAEYDHGLWGYPCPACERVKLASLGNPSNTECLNRNPSTARRYWLGSKNVTRYKPNRASGRQFGNAIEHPVMTIVPVSKTNNLGNYIKHKRVLPMFPLTKMQDRDANLRGHCPHGPLLSSICSSDSVLLFMNRSDQVSKLVVHGVFVYNSRSWKSSFAIGRESCVG